MIDIKANHKANEKENDARKTQIYTYIWMKVGKRIAI